MSSFTPGPWRIENHAGTQNGPFVAIWKGKERVAVVDECDKANARLIAAAPDLLAACRGMVNLISPDDLMAPQLWIEKRAAIVAAIAKAEGQL